MVVNFAFKLLLSASGGRVVTRLLMYISQESGDKILNSTTHFVGKITFRRLVATPPPDTDKEVQVRIQ